jgi:uncharacterized membrane protein HdeD (DUF308 family)
MTWLLNTLYGDREEDGHMAFFRRRTQVREDQGTTATARNEYERSAAAPRHARPGTPESRSQQYESPAAGPESERSGPAYQAGESRRGPAEMPRGLPGGWVAELLLGLATVVIGVIVAFHPMHTLVVLAILVGVLMIVSGVYHVIRSLRSAGDHRMWGGIAGVLFFLAGIFLIRHLSLTLSLIALFAGFAFIIAGIAGLAEAFSGRGRMGRGWSAFFGLICLFAGIAAITTPIGSLARLAIVLGWAFVAMGILHMIGAFVERHELRERSRTGRVSIPGQRATEPADAERAPGGAPPATAAGVGADSSGRRRRRG